jgi:transposase
MASKNNQNEVNAGVDTVKSQLDMHIHSLDVYFVITSDKVGIKEVITVIKKKPVTPIVIEATER